MKNPLSSEEKLASLTFAQVYSTIARYMAKTKVLVNGFEWL